VIASIPPLLTMSKISESDALAIINADVPFGITFTTADESRGSAGRRITSMQAKRIGSNHNEMVHGTITIEMIDHDSKKVTVHRKLIDFVNGQKVIC